MSAVRPSMVGRVPAGAAGTRATLKIMAALVRQYRISQHVRDLALRIVARLPEKRYLDELEAMRQWVQSHVRYTRDVHGVETIHTPDAVIELRQGDCDDQATLLATLLESVGMRTRFVAVGPTSSNFAHVFAEAYIQGYGWVPAETTEPVPLGWRPQMAAEMIEEVR
jgi:transglutaminase-like putative cysteine protease